MTSPVAERTAQITQEESVFELKVHTSGLAHLVINDKKESVNTLKESFISEIGQIFTEIRENSAIKGLLIISGKADSFIAGADIHMLDDCNSVEQASNLSLQGQQLFFELEQLNIPVLVAIHGACLGGGLELALACHFRICSDDEKTLLGLPEVQLGLLPGSGGTQRLPRVVGLQKALDMMLTGKQLRAKQALKYGLVDDVVPNSVLLMVAETFLTEVIDKKITREALMANKKNILINWLLENNSMGRKLIYQQAKKTVLNKTKGNYPAPLDILTAVETGLEQSAAKGYGIEAKLFGKLVKSAVSKELRQLFFTTQAMKKEHGVKTMKPQVIAQVGVLGGGLMGGGISYVSASKANLPVRVKDISAKGLLASYRYAYQILMEKVKRRFITHKQMQRQLANITATTDYTGFKHLDLVVEAVFEDVTLKQQMVADIEKHCQTDTIFASNTSSIPIAQIAAKAKRPENVIGLHYFSPVDKMPLVEVIPHQSTSEQTISTVVAFAKKQGKTPIVVKDSAGFYVNRILAPYMNEAVSLLLAGMPVDKLDKALVQFGFPVGPMQLLDEVGIDIASKIAPVLQAELGERFTPPDVFQRLITDGRLGKKAHKGFYLYGGKNNKPVKKKIVDESVYKLLDIHIQEHNHQNDFERCIFVMLNEAARCLEEGVIQSARDGDIGAIFGIGFPPFLGGPFRYMDSLGIDKVVAKLLSFSQANNSSFTPCQLLLNMAENNDVFHR